MKCYFDLYVSEELIDKKSEILHKIENKQVQMNKYIIVLSKNEKNSLEFYDTALLRQDVFEKESLFVVGIGDGYSGCLKLIETITQEVLDKTGGTDIRRYFIERQREFEERRI